MCRTNTWGSSRVRFSRWDYGINEQRTVPNGTAIRNTLSEVFIRAPKSFVLLAVSVRPEMTSLAKIVRRIAGPGIAP